MLALQRSVTLSLSSPWASFTELRFISSRDSNCVTLAGSAYSNLLDIGHGTSQFYFKTHDNKANYTIHNVYISRETQKVLNQPIVKGQNLYISGRLRAQKFVCHDGSKRDLFRVQARTIYTCEPYYLNDMQDEDIDELHQTTLDHNHIELKEQICFDINHFEKFSSLTLAHNFPRPDSSIGTAFFSVFVYDDYIKEYARNNLSRLDYVWVKGLLKYKPTVDDQGKKRYGGYIRANNICKIIPLSITK